MASVNISNNIFKDTCRNNYEISVTIKYEREKKENWLTVKYFLNISLIYFLNFDLKVMIGSKFLNIRWCIKKEIKIIYVTWFVLVLKLKISVRKSFTIINY